MKTEQCSETSAHKIQTPGNYPEESIQHSERGESLKSRNSRLLQRIKWDVTRRARDIHTALGWWLAESHLYYGRHKGTDRPGV
jgi:hypothetical protein